MARRTYGLLAVLLLLLPILNGGANAAEWTNPFLGLPATQEKFDAMWRWWVVSTFFSPWRGPEHARLYASFVNANMHIPGGNETLNIWRQFMETGQADAGVPILCPLSTDDNLNCITQILTWEGLVDQLAAVAFSEIGLQRLGKHPDLQAAHRLIPLPGSARDMNPPNLALMTGEEKDAQNGCKVLYAIGAGYGTAAAYSANVTSPASGRLLNITHEKHLEGLKVMNRSCAINHMVGEPETGLIDAHCLVFNPVTNAHGLKRISAVAGKPGEVPDLAPEGLQGLERMMKNIELANAVTKLNLPAPGTRAADAAARALEALARAAGIDVTYDPGTAAGHDDL